MIIVKWVLLPEPSNSRRRMQLLSRKGPCVLGSVYTNVFSFVTASFSMRLRFLFTRHRSRLLAKLGRFEIAARSVALSKRLARLNGETASI